MCLNCSWWENFLVCYPTISSLSNDFVYSDENRASGGDHRKRKQRLKKSFYYLVGHKKKKMTGIYPQHSHHMALMLLLK